MTVYKKVMFYIVTTFFFVFFRGLWDLYVFWRWNFLRQKSVRDKSRAFSLKSSIKIVIL